MKNIKLKEIENRVEMEKREREHLRLRGSA